MDPARLLRTARSSAELSKVMLARKGATSVSALVAYETGQRSPTVATLNRLLAACGLQLRGDLEPLHADVDAVVDRVLSAGPARLGNDAVAVAQAFDVADVEWALDARSACLAHGLAVDPPLGAEIAAVDSLPLRLMLDELWARPRDLDGMPFQLHWADLDISRLGPQPMWTRAGFVLVRIVPSTAGAVRIRVADDVTCPVLGLLEVERAHPGLAHLLERLRHRRTVSA